MSRRYLPRLWWAVAWTSQLLLLSAVIAGAYWLHYGHYQLLSVQSNSMRPVFQKGDAVLVHRVGRSQLLPGTIISYHSPANPRVIISHRLKAVDTKTDMLTTKGDALKTDDPPVPSGAVVGEATALVPFAGRVIDWLHRPLGLAVLVYLPAILLLGYELKQLLVSQTHRSYRAYSFR